MRLIPSTLCKAHRTYVWHACTICTWWPYKSSGAPGFGIRPVFHTYVVKSQKFTFKTSILLPYNLDLLDITSQRKLAHIQRLILLNFHYKSITDIPVGTYPLAICDQSVLPVPKFILFYFYIFPEHNCYMDANDNLACWTALRQSPSLIKFMFSYFPDE